MKTETRILLIDDDQVFLKMLQKLLSPEVSVEITSSYDAVLKYFSQNTCDFVFIDYDLTGPFKSDGLDLFKELKIKHGVNGYIMSSYGESLKTLDDKVNTSGISGVLSKDNIVQEIKDVLREHGYLSV